MFQTMTTSQFAEADDDEDMRRECNMILQMNGSMFERVNSVLSMLRKNKNENI